MSWRTEEWVNPHSRKYLKNLYGDKPYRLEDEEAKIFEAGADAILEALRGQGVSTKEIGTVIRGNKLIIYVPKDSIGKWVFIPDEPMKKES